MEPFDNASGAAVDEGVFFDPERAAVVLGISLMNPERQLHFVLPSRQVLLGREATCDFMVPDPTVSRRHCVVRVGVDGVRLRDCGSVHGIFVNGIRLGEALLMPPAHFRLGDAEMSVQLVPVHMLEMLPGVQWATQVKRADPGTEKVTGPRSSTKTLLGLRGRITDPASYPTSVTAQQQAGYQGMAPPPTSVPSPGGQVTGGLNGPLRFTPGR